MIAGATPVEQEVLWGRRAFPKAQELMAGVPLRSLGRVEVGWHHTDIHAESGAFCVVRRGGPYEELLGEILIVRYGQRDPVFVYCVNTAALVADISLTRRAFLAVARLTHDRLPLLVEVRA